ncbi:unnamed protein product [Lampetra fluviatilis]
MRRRDGPVIATSQCNDRSRKAPGPREARGDLRGAAGVERGAGCARLLLLQLLLLQPLLLHRHRTPRPR